MANTELHTPPDINALKQQRDAYLSAAAKLDAAIKLLEGNADKPVDWKNSALKCIKQHGFPMRTVDILNCMAIADSQKFLLKDFKKRHNYVSALSIALNNLCDNGVLGRMKYDGFKGYFYGVKDWHVGMYALVPEINEKFMHALWKDQDSIFNFSELENDLLEDDVDDDI
jgi:hypothetical protein